MMIGDGDMYAGLRAGKLTAYGTPAVRVALDRASPHFDSSPTYALPHE